MNRHRKKRTSVPLKRNKKLDRINRKRQTRVYFFIMLRNAVLRAENDGAPDGDLYGFSPDDVPLNQDAVVNTVMVYLRDYIPISTDGLSGKDWMIRFTQFYGDLSVWIEGLFQKYPNPGRQNFISYAESNPTDARTQSLLVSAFLLYLFLYHPFIPRPVGLPAPRKAAPIRQDVLKSTQAILSISCNKV